MLVYGEATIHDGVGVGDNLLISSLVWAELLAITLASANAVLKFWVSCSHILSNTFWTLLALAAIIAAVFCCPASIAFSMFEFTQQNHCVISVVWLASACWLANCCCRKELLLISSTVLSWLLLLFASQAIHAALLFPHHHNPLPFPIKRNKIRMINHVPMFHIQKFCVSMIYINRNIKLVFVWLC